MKSSSKQKRKHLSAARLTKYEVALLSPSHVTFNRCTVLNPDRLLPLGPEEGTDEWEELKKEEKERKFKDAREEALIKKKTVKERTGG